jgi:hypothetical protein
LVSARCEALGTRENGVEGCMVVHASEVSVALCAMPS